MELKVSSEAVIVHDGVETCYRGNWHGDVAIKMLDMDPDSDNKSQLQSFKLEVCTVVSTSTP